MYTSEIEKIKRELERLASFQRSAGGVGDVSSLAASDGSPNPAWSVDAAGNLTNPGNGVFDLNGIADALVLDADADTSLSSPTDDQIDIEVNGADIARFISNGLLLLTPSTIDLDGIADALVLDADADTSISAPTDDQIDIEVNSVDIARFTTAGLILPSAGGGIIDVDGTADAIVLDADADTSISSPTDDQIDFEAGGTDIARITSVGVSLPQTGDDFFADGDNFGLWQRLINYGFTPSEHWRQGANELSWTGFASYTGFATPGTVTRTDSKLTVDHSASTRAFYYRSFINAQTQLTARLGTNITGASAEVGLMVDDGSGNADGLGADNFFRIFVESLGTNSFWNLCMEYRTGGGAVTKTTSSITLIPAQMYGILMLYGVGTRWSSWSGRFRMVGEAGVEPVTGASGTFSWTPSRHGLYYRNVNGAGRAVAWDWFHES